MPAPRKWFDDDTATGWRARKHRERQRNKRNERKAYFVEMKGNKCHDCGQTFPICCYDFHHLDESTKSFEIAPGLDREINILTEEVNKTIMLCSNCHRIRHSINSPTLDK